MTRRVPIVTIVGERAMQEECNMSVQQAVVEKLRDLPDHHQREVLDFVEYLAQKNRSRKPRRSLKGLCADLGIHITEEDIAEARREMWGNFPREDF